MALQSVEAHDPQRLGGLRFRPRCRRRHVARHRARLRAGQDRAARRGDRPQQYVPARPVAATRRARTPRHHRGGGVGRQRARLSRTLRGDGGSLARLGVGRAFLRRPFQSLRQPDPPQRQRSAEAPLPAEADFGRACGRARHVGAGRGLGRGLHAHARGAQGRPLHPQRLENVDHQRAGGRDPGGLCEDRPECRRARDHRFPDREGHEGILDRAKARQARHARLRYLRTGVRRLRGAGGERARQGQRGREGPDVRPRL